MRVAIYCRLSEEDRNKQTETDDSTSIQNQKSMLLQYAKEQNWHVYRIYSDDDYAGADRRRPEFNRLLEDGKNHKFDIVLCKTQSRFTRELELVEKYIHGLFPLWGIRFVSVVDNGDTDNKGNKKSRQINGLVNEWYLEDMSENIRSVLTNRRQNGLHIGSFALYGYQKDPNQKGHLIIDPDAAAVVRDVFSLFSQGYGKTAIARILNDRGVPNPTEYKRQQGLRYQQPKGSTGTLWKYFSIANMLSNEIYIGNMVQGRYGSASYKTKENRPRPKDSWYIVEGTHDPIISRQLWDRVQERIAQRTKPLVTGSIGLFAKKARCANCGYTMRSSKNHSRYYLRCSNRHVSKDACIGSFMGVDALEGMVVDELNRLIDQYLNKDALEQQLAKDNDWSGQQERLVSALSACDKKTQEYAAAIRNAYLDKTKELITENMFADFSSAFTLELERLAWERLALHARLKEFRQDMAQEDKRQQAEPYTHVVHLTREMVEVLIDYIMVGNRIPGTRKVPIEIHWRF